MSPPEVVRKKPFPQVADVIERPLLYSGPMVVAVLRVDDPKTQTRRCVTRLAGFGQVTEFGRSDTPGYDWHFRDSAMRWHDVMHTRLLECCPYGLPGDRLWVRETWQHQAGGNVFDAAGGVADSHEDEVIYRASRQHYPGPWRPSIFMPRWASRILLEVTEVRVERLQDISEADARAEGIVAQQGGGWGLPAGEHFHMTDTRMSIWSLWETINGPGSVETNPWVWAVSFRKVAP